MSTETAPQATPRAGSAAPLVLPLYTLTLFLSAFLLFAVQPMFTKMVLPLLGGSAAVWNTAVVFFQGTLLLGYFYAHLSTRHLGPRAQAIVHVVVLLTGFVFLPFAVAGWTPPAEGLQIPWLIGLLAVSIGLPFFAVSATAPLLQKWFAHTDHAAADDPYFLYGGSNLGSLAALLLYPFLVEPLLGLRAQGRAWTGGYALLVLAIGTCGLVLVRRWRPVVATAGAEGGSGEHRLVAHVDWKLRLQWLVLSVVPSALLLGTTLHMSTGIASAPFLWVLPLALYLLTFVLAFARKGPGAFRVVVWCHAVVLACLAALFEEPELWALLLIHTLAMFFTAWVCHERLAKLRPVAAHLTEFYLWMSIGGVVGGILASIVAPLVFDGVYEYPLALLAGLLLRPRPKAGSGRARVLGLVLDLGLPGLLFLMLAQGWWQSLFGGWGGSGVSEVLPEGVVGTPGPDRYLQASLIVALILLSTRPLRFCLGFVAVLLHVSPLALGMTQPGASDDLVYRARSFFGVYRVHELKTPLGRFHFLMNGGVLHGGQNLDRPLAPTTYYTREGPVGQFFTVLKDLRPPVEHIGVVGLGVGAVAPYLNYGQHLTYFEIDALDEEIARDPELFTYLPDKGDQIDVKIGDGRLQLEKEPDGSFGAIIVAAFSGDAIPVHLLTQEALDLYVRKLRPGGLVLFNVTNTYLDLMPVLGNQVAASGLHARFSRDVMPMRTAGGSKADYVVVARRAEELARFGNLVPRWPVLEPDPSTGLWTDDFSDILEVLRWEAISDLGASPHGETK